MAKLSAHGRTELARVARTYVGVGETEGQSTTYTYALMSDGKTLRKVNVVWADGHVSNRPWSLATKWRYPAERAAWLAVFARAGFEEVTK